MLTDPYKEIKQWKFWSEKICWDTLPSIAFKNHCWLFFKIVPSIRNAFFHRVDVDISSWTARRPARGKPPVSWHPLRKDLCQCWIIRFTKHSSPYASRSKAQISPISFPNQTQKSVTARCLERMHIFSLFHTLINTGVDLLRLPLLLYSLYTLSPYLVQMIYFSSTCLCVSKYCTLVPSFSMVHSPQHLIPRRGLSTCSYKTRHISPAVSHSELIPCFFDTYWTIEHNRVWE